MLKINNYKLLEEGVYGDCYRIRDCCLLNNHIINYCSNLFNVVGTENIESLINIFGRLFKIIRAIHIHIF